MNKNISYAYLFLKRVTAFIIDFLGFVTFFTIFQRIYVLFMPGNDVRVAPMQLFTQKDFNVFFASVFSALILITIYSIVSYRVFGKTIGHKLMKIELISLSGKKLSLLGYLRVTCTSVLRVILILLPGPLLAYLFDMDFAASLFALLWGIAVVLPIPVRREPEMVTLWQLVGDHKFIFTNER